MQNENPNPLDPIDGDRDDWDGSIEPATPPEKHLPTKATSQLVCRVWSPQPLARPAVDPDLPRMEWPARVAEVLVYSGKRFEFWVSPSGFLREWVKLNIWVAVVLSVAAVLVVPAMTAILAGAEQWTALVAKIVGNTMTAVLRLPPIVLSVAAIVVTWHFLKTRWLTRRRNPRPPKQEGFDQYQ